MRMNLSGIKNYLRKLKHAPPRGLKSIGENSYIYKPFKVYGANHIEIGNRTSILSNGVVNAIVTYEAEVFRPTIRIGSDVYIGHYVYIVAAGEITIGDRCVLSDHVYITDVLHGVDPEGGLILKQKLINKGAITIGESTFIGYRVCVLPGVTLGKHCVVGSNSVVTHSFPDYTMLAGSPAKVIKTYCLEKHEWVSAE